MAALKELGTRGNLVYLEYKLLEIDPDFNVRTDYGDIEELAVDIAAHGIHRPLRVRMSADGTKAIVVDGHRRHMAAGIAIDRFGAQLLIPCMSETRGTNDESRIIDMLVANDNAKALTPVEEGEAYRRLLAKGWDVAKIVKETAKKPAYINERLELIAAPVEVREAVTAGRMTPRTAKTVSKAAPEARAAILAKPAAKPGKVAKVTEKAVNAELGRRVSLTNHPKEVKGMIEDLSASRNNNHSAIGNAYFDGMIAFARVMLGDMTMDQAIAVFAHMPGESVAA